MIHAFYTYTPREYVKDTSAFYIFTRVRTRKTQTIITRNTPQTPLLCFFYRRLWF